MHTRMVLGAGAMHHRSSVNVDNTSELQMQLSDCISMSTSMSYYDIKYEFIFMGPDSAGNSVAGQVPHRIFLVPISARPRLG